MPSILRCLSLLLLCLAPSALAAQAPPRWRVNPRPSVVLGADERQLLLAEVVGATQLPDRTILVGDRGDFALRQFAPDGRLLRSFGRKGSGPGEISYLISLLRCGDSVFTRDVEEGHRVNVFDTKGRYVRAFRFGGPPPSQLPYQTTCNGSGTFAHLGWETRNDMRAGAFRSRVPVWLSHADSGVARLIDSVPGSERWGKTVKGQLVGTRPMPLGKEPVLAMGSGLVWVGSADSFVVRSYSLSGRPGTTLRRDVPVARRTTADVAARIFQDTLGRTREDQRSMLSEFAEIEMPSTLPAYTHLIVDKRDHIWVRGYARATAATVMWSVFAPSGRLVAEVLLPPGLTVYEIGDDYILGRFQSVELDAPVVHLYQLTRTVGAAGTS